MIKSTTKDIFLNILKVLVGITLFYLIIKDVQINELKESFRKGQVNYILAGGLVITFSQVFIQTLRFHYIIRRLQLRFQFSLDLTLIGLFFNNLLPTAIGGDIVRTLLLRDRTSISYSQAITYVAVHRASGILTLVAMFVLYLVFNFEQVLLIIRSLGISIDFSAPFYVIIALILMIMVIAFFKSRFRDFIKKGLDTLTGFKRSELFVIVLLAAVYHVTTMFGYFLLVKFFHESIDFQSLIIVQTFTAVVALIPISIGALGLMEGTILGMFMFFGLARSSSTGIALIIRLLLILFALCGLLIVLFNKKYTGISLLNKKKLTN